MNKLLALADRVEKLTGPDRETDWRIAEAIGVGEWRQSTVWPPFMKGSKVDKSIPAYTASLDAAWSLIPDGFKVREFEQDSSHEWQWWCWLTTDAAEGNGSSFHHPQLALLAAALRAIEDAGWKVVKKKDG